MDKDDDAEDETQGKSRYPVLPSLIALQQMRNRLATAKSGRRLMQWSALATGAELRRIAKELGLVYVAFADEVANAFMMLARCRYFYPNLNKMVTQNNPSKACVTVGRNFRSIAGCKISTFGIEDNCSDSYPLLAIDRGGDTVAETKKAWYELLRKLIWINQLRSNFISLQNSHDQTNKKSKVLGKIIIPRTQVTIRYILSELEELEREEFFRLKKVLEVKYRYKKKNQKKDGEEKKEVKKEETKEVKKEVATEVKTEVKKEVKTEVKKEVKKEVKTEVKKEEKREEKKEKNEEKEEEECPFCEMEREKIDTCIICDGPMHPSDWKPMTGEQADKERAAISDIKENLDRILLATEDYEKSTPRKDNLIEEFKQTTTELKDKLRTRPLPESIPRDVSVEKLCDICKEMHNELYPKCVVCSQLIAGVDDKELVAAKESRKQLRNQLDTVLDTIQKYDKEGMEADKLIEFKLLATELKKKLLGPPIPKHVDIDKLCADCKDRIKESDQSAPSKSGSKQPLGSKATTPSVANSGVSFDLPLGVFETEEITEIIQVKNPDGTVIEKRRIVTIKRKPGPADKSDSATSSNKDKKVGLVSVIVNRKRLAIRLPGDSQSEYAIKSLPMVERMIKDCMSLQFDCGYDEAVQNITELSSRDTSDSSEMMASSDERNSN